MNNIITYIRESFQEVKDNVTWPTLSELQSSTVIVIVASLIFALLIWLIDTGFDQVISKLI